MKRLIFNEDHEMFRDSVRRFMQAEIGPHVERWREAGICDKDAFRKAGEQGLLCMWADEKYGGLGMEDLGKIALTYLVPYAVATWSAVQTARAATRETE